jgi:hypothetical protein
MCYERLKMLNKIEFTSSLVRALKGKDFIKATIEISLKIHNEENNQILCLADYIRNEVLSDLQTNGSVPGFHIAESLTDISYSRNDYIDAAKELTRLYSKNQKYN